jgi:hypothetical protein
LKVAASEQVEALKIMNKLAGDYFGFMPHIKPSLSLRGLKPARVLRVKTGQGFDEWDVLFAGFSGGLFGLSRCAGLAGFGSGWF